MRTRLVLLPYAWLSLLPACLTPIATDAGNARVADAAIEDAALPVDAELLIDAPTMCPPEPPLDCDVFLSCGCASDAGQKCSIVSGAHGCRGAGDKLAGEVCEHDPACAPGTLCAPIGKELRCLAFCDDIHPCPDGEACYIRVASTSDPPDRVCGQVCELLQQDCAIDGESCYSSRRVPIEEHGVCGLAGEGTQGVACKSPNDCSLGFLCVRVPDQDTFACAQLCDRFVVDAGCPDQTGCGELSGHIRTGVCL